MLHNVFLKTLYDQRYALLGWGIGMLMLALASTLLYPSVSASMSETGGLLGQLSPMVKAMIGGFNMTTLPGYLEAHFFSFVVPILFLGMPLTFGAAAIAGEEKLGTMNLLLSAPLFRWQIVVQKFTALVVALVMVGFTLWIGLAFGIGVIGVDFSLGRLAETTVSCVLLGLAFGTLALAIGCATGNRGLSLGITGAIAMAAYFINSLAPVAKMLEPFRKLTPFYYYISAEPLINGLNLGHASVLIGMTAVLLVVAMVTFERRDVGC